MGFYALQRDCAKLSVSLSVPLVFPLTLFFFVYTEIEIATKLIIFSHYFEGIEFLDASRWVPLYNLD